MSAEITYVEKYYHQRQEDLVLAEFMVKNGIAPREDVQSALAVQEDYYDKAAKMVPRLSELLLQDEIINPGLIPLLSKAFDGIKILEALKKSASLRPEAPKSNGRPVEKRIDRKEEKPSSPNEELLSAGSREANIKTRTSWKQLARMDLMCEAQRLSDQKLTEKNAPAGPLTLLQPHPDSTKLREKVSVPPASIPDGASASALKDSKKQEENHQEKKSPSVRVNSEIPDPGDSSTETVSGSNVEASRPDSTGPSKETSSNAPAETDKPTGKSRKADETRARSPRFFIEGAMVHLEKISDSSKTGQSEEETKSTSRLINLGVEGVRILSRCSIRVGDRFKTVIHISDLNLNLEAVAAVQTCGPVTSETQVQLGKNMIQGSEKFELNLKFQKVTPAVCREIESLRKAPILRALLGRGKAKPQEKNL